MSVTLAKSAQFDDVVASEIAEREGREGGVLGSAAEDIGRMGSMGSLRHHVGGSGPQGMCGSGCGSIETGQRQLVSCVVCQASNTTVSLLSESCVIEDRRTRSHLTRCACRTFLHGICIGMGPHVASQCHTLSATHSKFTAPVTVEIGSQRAS